MNREELVLILQNDHDIFDGLHRACRAGGLQTAVRFCRNGYEVASYFSGAGIYRDRELYPLPSLFVLDLEISGWNSLDFLGSLRRSQRFVTLPVLGTGGRKDGAAIQRAFDYGLNGYYELPREIPELASSLRRLERVLPQVKTQLGKRDAFAVIGR